MKQSKSIILTMCILMVFSFGIMTNASEKSEPESNNIQDIKAKLEPYQSAVDELNRKYGSTMEIPNDGLEEVYNNIKNKSVDLFKKELERDYLEAVQLTENSSGPKVMPYKKDELKTTGDEIVFPADKSVEPIKHVL